MSKRDGLESLLMSLSRQRDLVAAIAAGLRDLGQLVDQARELARIDAGRARQKRREAALRIEQMIEAARDAGAAPRDLEEFRRALCRFRDRMLPDSEDV